MTIEASFLPVNGSDRFCLLHLPQGKPRGGIVYVHPFAEEMNRSRHVVAEQARAFAARGYAVLQIDLYGCGDSAGDFGEASWVRWRQDVHAAVVFLQARFDMPLCLWALRSGALIASEVACELQTPISLLLWQPVLSGKQHLQQFLRLSMAGDLLEGKPQTSTEALLTRLANGQPVEVVGYSIAPSLAEGLSASELALPRLRQRMHCIEITPGGGELSPALRRFVESGPVDSSICADAQCWLTQGIVHCPALTEASQHAIESLLP